MSNHLSHYDGADPAHAEGNATPETPESWAGLPREEFAFPGPLRDRLVSAILEGRKTSGTALLTEYLSAGETLPRAGDRSVLVDSGNRPVAVLERTAVRIARLADVDEAHVHAEGEGYEDVAAWRAAHEEFWESPAYIEVLSDPTFRVDDDTLVVLDQFRVCERRPDTGA